MLHLLPIEQYDTVKPLFDNDAIASLYCQGILSGKYPGKVLVDDPHQPQNALIIKDSWCHLIGAPDNVAFNEALKRELAEKKLIGEKNVLFFVEPPTAWLVVLAKLVQNRQLIEMPRCLYAATPTSEFPESSLSAGFALHFIDDTISEKVDDELPEDVQKVLDLRSEAETPDEMAFGFVAVNGRSLAAWSVVDYIVGDVGEIRLVTETNYRCLGLATATSAATIAYGLTNGLNQIDWNVAAANTPSVRTAQKLGLHLLSEPKEYILIFPEVGYLINLAWSHLDAQRFEQVHLVTEQMVSSDKGILVKYGHFLTGAAWAGLGNHGKAFLHLNKAIDAGFDALSELENCTPLTILHSSAEWSQLLTRVKNLKND